MSASLTAYPGTSQHQALLRAVVDHYHADPRILAVVVFGSLGRGNWDEYSDLDLDLVIEDGVQVDVLAELRRLADAFTPLGERLLLLEPDGPDAGDMVLASLLGLSVRYHPLRTTSPNIVDSLLVLDSRVHAEAIQVAGLANVQRGHAHPAGGLDHYLRLAVEAHHALCRRQFWRAFQLLHLMRELALAAFTVTHGGARPYHTFQAQADTQLQIRLGQTLPTYSLASAQQALLAFLDLVEYDLDALTNGLLHLSAAHREVLALVRGRQAQVQFAEG